MSIIVDDDFWYDYEQGIAAAERYYGLRRLLRLEVKKALGRRALFAIEEWTIDVYRNEGDIAKHDGAVCGAWISSDRDADPDEPALWWVGDASIETRRLALLARRVITARGVHDAFVATRYQYFAEKARVDADLDGCSRCGHVEPEIDVDIDLIIAASEFAN